MDDIGARLRLAREAAGLSLAAMAARTYVSKAHLGNVETGRRRATRDIVVAYERVLGDDVRRRGVLAGISAAAVAPEVVSRLLQHGFSAALTHTVGVDEWMGRVARYGRDYMSVGAAQLQADLARDLMVLQQQLEHEQLWAQAARLLAVYGKTTANSVEAIGWYRLAATLADRSGRDDVRVWVRSRAALALAYEAAAPRVAARFARQALAISDRPSLGQLNALMATAHVLAQRGDPDGAVRADEAAQRVFDQVGSTEQVSDFAVPEWRMATFRSMLYARLGDTRRATAAQETADATRPATLPRFATHIELHRALLRVRAGDRNGGVLAARAAIAALPAQRHSLSLRLMLAEVERAAQPQSQVTPRRNAPPQRAGTD
jgi:transcriptional regulator with XRE-family HTH domain